MRKFFKITGKWLVFLVGGYLVMQWLSGLDIETRFGWCVFGLALAIAYIDGTHKDKVSNLEARIADLERQLYGHDRQTLS